MASRVDSARARVTPTRDVSPAVPVVLFVGLSGIANVALNRLVALYQPVLPSSIQFEYVVTAPLTPAGAGVTLLGAGVAMVCSLALFVESVGVTESSGSTTTSGESRLTRIGRATGAVAVGSIAIAAGLALFVVPGLVGLVYLPFVFIGIVLEGETVAGALEASHARIGEHPAPVATTVLALVFCLLVIGLGGTFSSILPPTVEFVVGGVASALVVLLGLRRLTRLYQRLPSRSVTAESGRL